MTTAPIRHSAPKPPTIHRASPDPAVFALKSTQETLVELQRPIDERWIQSYEKPTKGGSMTLRFVPWAIIAKHLTHRAPGWCWEVQDVKEVGGSVVVTGRLTIPTQDSLLHYSSVASEPLESGSKAPPVETAASSALRRAAALAGLGLDLWIN